MTDPQTWWLNLTNIALGAGVLLCCLAVVLAIAREIVPRPRRRA